MNTALKLAPRTFPSRVADLGFTADLPADWIAHELPQETVDVSDPTAFIPLAVITAPHAALIFAFAARPAYDNGTLHDWSWFHLQHQEMQPRAIGPDVVAGVAAMTGEATKDSEMGPMVIRFAFFEDGGRLVCLTFSAPELLADAVREAWFSMLRSFRLESSRGSRFPVENHPDLSSPAPAVEPAAEETPATPALVPPLEMPVPADIKPRKCRLADFALAEDTASLDPEMPINANLRDRGIGLVPRVLEVSAPARRVSLGAGAIEARIDVPFGWHVIDDGRRTLVFEPSGKIQINLDLIPVEGRDRETILDAIESDIRDSYTSPEFVRVTDGPIRALGARGLVDGDQALEQYHLLYPYRDKSMVVRARVTATPEKAIDASTLGSLILTSCAFAPVATPQEEPTANILDASASEPAARDGKPAWWLRALELEAQGQLEAAENTIRDGCPYVGFAASTAEMYRLRMLRLKTAGDRAGALAAFKKASDFISFYASMATSGGEGAALSYERDQFRAQLVAEYGCDPEARCA